MYVAVHHQISEPGAFWNAVREATPNIPEPFSLHQCLPHPAGDQAFCVWEGESVAAVRELVESAVGSYSRNEYFEVEATGGVNLPSTLARG